MAEGDRDAEDTKVNWWRSGQLVSVRRRSERHRSTGRWQRETTTTVTSTHQRPVIYKYQPISIVIIACLVRVCFILLRRSARHFPGAPGTRRQTPIHLKPLSTSPRLGWLFPCTQRSFESNREYFSATIESVIAATASLKLP